MTHSEPIRQIVFLSTSTGCGCNHDPGGGECFAKEFLLAMRSKRWAIQLMAPLESPLIRDPALRAAIEILPLDLSCHISHIWRFARVTARLAALAARSRGAVIYGNGYEAMKWLVVCKFFGATAVVCHLHESEYQCYHSRRARWLSRWVDLFIAISQTVHDQFIIGSGTPPAKVRTIHMAVPVNPWEDKKPSEVQQYRQRLSVPAKNLLVVMVARTDPLKGHEVLLKAVNRVRATVPDVMFMIVGLQERTPEEADVYGRVQCAIEEEGIRDAVRVISYTHEARRIMRASDVVVVPSISEGFGRTAVEAMAEGTPVIVSRVGGLAEIVTHWQNGLQFVNGDSADLADRLIELLRDPDLRRRIAQAGYQTAVEHFSTEHMVSRIEQVLVELLHRRSDASVEARAT